MGLSFLVVTVSTSKYAGKLRGIEVNDESGDLAEETVRDAGYRVVGRKLISDDAMMLKKVTEEFLDGEDDVAVFVGGTGISPTDVTIESVRPYFERELEGFGEILRGESYRSIGSAAFLTRATAGVARGKLIACMPGSPDAVGTGLRLFVGFFPSILREARA